MRVVILGGAGPIFSSGHDLGSKESIAERMPGPGPAPDVPINGGTRKGAESRMLQEWHYFFENTKRWRNLRKITIAQVNGTVYAAGLMLMWACDLIVACRRRAVRRCRRYAARDVRGGVLRASVGVRAAQDQGADAHGGRIDVEEAYRLGMVSKVFPTDELADRTLEFAGSDRGAADDDRVVDQGVGEPVGRQHGLPERAGGVLHDPPAQPRALGRGAREPVAGRLLEEDGIPNWKTAPPIVLAEKDTARADA